MYTALADVINFYHFWFWASPGIYANSLLLWDHQSMGQVQRLLNINGIPSIQDTSTVQYSQIQKDSLHNFTGEQVS